MSGDLTLFTSGLALYALYMALGTRVHRWFHTRRIVREVEADHHMLVVDDMLARQRARRSRTRPANDAADRSPDLIIPRHRHA